jgi:hypothetical protein
MTEIVLGVLATLFFLTSVVLWRRVKMLAKAMAHLLKATTNIASALEEVSSALQVQAQVNDQIGTSLEMLGVHTKLIEPSISYEASQFLAWVNKNKKEEK